MRDMAAKERGGLTKLTASQAAEIYQRSVAGESSASLGREFGVSRMAASAIKHKRTWEHIHA